MQKRYTPTKIRIALCRYISFQTKVRMYLSKRNSTSKEIGRQLLLNFVIIFDVNDLRVVTRVGTCDII